MILKARGLPAGVIAGKAHAARVLGARVRQRASVTPAFGHLGAENWIGKMEISTSMAKSGLGHAKGRSWLVLAVQVLIAFGVTILGAWRSVAWLMDLLRIALHDCGWCGMGIDTASLQLASWQRHSCRARAAGVGSPGCLASWLVMAGRGRQEQISISLAQATPRRRALAVGQLSSAQIVTSPTLRADKSLKQHPRC